MVRLPTKFVTAPKFIKELDTLVHQWKPERGTVYPLLKRLEKYKLVESTKDRPMQFRRTELGNVYLSTIAENLKSQFQVDLNYIKFIIQGMGSIDGEATRSLISYSLEQLDILKEDLIDLETSLPPLEDEDIWEDVVVSED